MTKYFQLFITIVAMGLFATNVQAQVTIGSDADPQSFSVLELDATTTGLGLRLPQVETTAQLNAIAASLNTADLKNSAKGLMVMNLEDKCLYVYDGDSWASHCGISTLKLENADKLTAILYGYDSNDPYNRGYGVGVRAPVAGSQTFAGSQNCNNMKIAYTNGLGKSISNYTSATVHGLTISYASKTLDATGDISLTLSGTPTKRGAFDIPVVIDGQTVRVRIHVGCGVYIGDYSRPDNYLLMMCINWGTSAYMNWSTDPFNPTKGSNGDYFQWGRKSAVGDVDNILLDPWAFTPAATDATIYCNKGIEQAPVKNEAYDPCPAGWRLPTGSEWFLAYYSIDHYMSGELESETNYSACKKIYPKVLPTNAATLCLPAAGSRENNPSGQLRYRGKFGYYWTSTKFSPYYSISVTFGSGFIQPANEFYAKNDGLSIRCVAE